MSSIWTYSARCHSRDGNYVVGYDYSLTELEYAIPDIRAFAERSAHDEVRHMEGVYPDMPIEGEWRELKLKDDK